MISIIYHYLRSNFINGNGAQKNQQINDGRKLDELLKELRRDDEEEKIQAVEIEAPVELQFNCTKNEGNGRLSFRFKPWFGMNTIVLNFRRYHFFG